MKAVFAVFGCLLVALLPFSANAASNLLFIVDGSNSMWGQVGGTPKIETAKKAFEGLTAQVPADVNIAVATYGHTNKTSCDDIAYLTPFVGEADRGKLSQAVNNITPTGKTPIAKSLEILGGEMAKKHEGDKNTIVLISDGVESCEGDPCAVAGMLASSNVDFSVHVVGFDIAEKDRKQLQCIAEKGKGRYFAANSTAGFKEAVAEAVKVSTEPAAAPPKAAESRQVFRDDFDGANLAEHWEVLNPDPNRFIVENGQLLLVSNQWAGFNTESFINLLLLNQELPKGDWKITARIKMPIQTKFEQVSIGVFDNASQWLGSSIAMINNRPEDLALMVDKLAGKDYTFFSTSMFKTDFQGSNFNVYPQKMPFDLVLVKQGRQFWATATSAVDPKITFRTQKITALRSSGRVAIGLSQRANQNLVKGETSAEIDWIKIEASE